MSYENLLIERDGRIAKLILNRPAKLNAITDFMEEEMGQAIKELGDDDDVGVVVLTGAGRAFSAGADVSELPGNESNGRGANPEAIRRNFRKAMDVILGIHKMQKPVIGMINGVAAGAGFDLACACDLRVGTTQVPVPGRIH